VRHVVNTEEKGNRNILGIRIKVIPDGNVAPVVHVERRLDVAVPPDPPQQLLQHPVAVLLQRLGRRVVREVVVVLVYQALRAEAALDQLRGDGVVTDFLFDPRERGSGRG